MFNPYKILFVDPDAPQEVIKASYRSLMKNSEYHPDLGGDEAKARDLNTAYETLKDEKKRSELNRELNKQKKEFSQNRHYYIVCYECYAVNEVPSPETIFRNKCTKCKQPFVFNQGKTQRFRQNTETKTAGLKRKKTQGNAPNEEFALYMYEKKLYTRALNDFKNLFKDSPKNLNYCYMTGMCYYRVFRYDSAKNYFLKALVVDPKHFLSNYYMGKSLMKEKRFAPAIEFLQNAVTLKTDSLKSHALIGIGYYKLAKYNEAIETLNYVATKDPALEQSIYYLSMSYYKRRDFEQAYSCFEICRQIYAKNDKIRQMLQHCKRHLNHS